MTRWKLQLRNKIEDSNIEEPVKRLQAGSDAELSTLAQSVSHQGYRYDLIKADYVASGSVGHSGAFLQDRPGIEDRLSGRRGRCQHPDLGRGSDLHL
jgi:hypothetical protein